MKTPHIPILRQGRPYKSLDTQTIEKLGTEDPAVEISFACADMIKHDLHKMDQARAKLRAMKSSDLIDITKKAGEIFLDTYRRVGIVPFKERVYAKAD